MALLSQPENQPSLLLIPQLLQYLLNICLLVLILVSTDIGTDAGPDTVTCNDTDTGTNSVLLLIDGQKNFLLKKYFAKKILGEKNLGSKIFQVKKKLFV